MASFILHHAERPFTMADGAVVTDKSHQLKVLGGLALASIVLIGTAQLFLQTPTLQYASLAVLGGVLVLIAYLAIEL